MSNRKRTLLALAIILSTLLAFGLAGWGIWELLGRLWEALA